MQIGSETLQITMDLYETDIPGLQEFMSHEEIEGDVTEKYLVLFNFAEDCKYAEYIQPELIAYLLPFYLQIIDQAVIYGNKIAKDIFSEFNFALFRNQQIFRYAIGENCYQNVMQSYIKKTVRNMAIKTSSILEWVSLYNVTIALDKDNISYLLKSIFGGSLKVKYAFFKYISVLLFKESDNLLAIDEKKVFWSSDIWDFDTWYADDIYWSDDSIEYFNKNITRERIEFLYGEVKPLICDVFEPGLVELFSEEMEQSFSMGVFFERKAEYLKKISCCVSSNRYWDRSF